MTYSAASASAVSVSTTTETTAVTSPLNAFFAGTNNAVSGAYGGVLVRGGVNFTGGSAATTVVWKVKQGSGTAGTLVASGTVTAVALALSQIPISVLDTSSVPSTQYSITVTQPAGTSNGTINYATIETDVVVP